MTVARYAYYRSPRDLREHRELVHRLAQHLGRRRTSLLQPVPVGQRRPVVGVGHVGQRGVDRAELPAPQVAGRLLSGFCWTPGDLAAFDEFHDVVLPHGTVGQRRLEHVTGPADALPGSRRGEVVVAVPARLAGRLGDQFENPLRAGRD